MLLLNVMTCVSWTFSMNKQKLAKHIREALRLNIICVLSNGMAMQVYVGFCNDRETPGVSIRYISSDIFCNPIILFSINLLSKNHIHCINIIKRRPRKKKLPPKKSRYPKFPNTWMAMSNVPSGCLFQLSNFVFCLCLTTWLLEYSRHWWSDKQNCK